MGPSQQGSVLAFIHGLSGQAKKCSIVESEHSYSKSWNHHPDPSIKSRPAKFLFMESFLKSNNSGPVEEIDVNNLPTDDVRQNPLVAEVSALNKGLMTSQEEHCSPESIPNKSTWTPIAQRLWAKALSILYSDRLIRLSIEGSPNEVVIRKMLAAKCANRFRHLFASVAFWDLSLLTWLHQTLCDHVAGQYLIAYHEAMQNLRQKLPTLIDHFYSVGSDTRNKPKAPVPDLLQTVLNNHKPKRIKSCPLFILVPNGPQAPNSILPQRLKHWQLLFASLGKIVTLSINYQENMKVKDCLNQIVSSVRDKINECRTNFTEGRPIILVGFGHSSLIAAHCALDNSSKVTATICLGFPLTGVNGFRGDLDDPLLDTTVATMFIIGQNSTMSSIDDMEDFRERMVKAETGLVIVGGANDNLVVSQTKQRFEGITQSIVDRCIADEIYDFINYVLNPHYSPTEGKDSLTLVRHLSVNRNHSGTSSSTAFKLNLVKAKSRPKKKLPSKKPESLNKAETSKRDSKLEAPSPTIPTIPEKIEPAPPPTPLKTTSTPSTPKESKKRAETATAVTTQATGKGDVTPSKRKKDEEVGHKEVDKKRKWDEESGHKEITKAPEEVIPGNADANNGSSTNTPITSSTPNATESTATTSTKDKIETSEKQEKEEKSDKSTTPTSNQQMGRHYDFSYKVFEAATVASSATRTRKIRAPKLLDM